MEQREQGSAGEGRRVDRRGLMKGAIAGGLVVAFGGALYVLRGDDQATREAEELRLPDGRRRLPPNQHVLTRLKPMGGDPGDPDPALFRLKVHGEVKHPFEIDYAALLKMPQVEQTCDVHCVTGWSVLDSHWMGVRLAHLAERAGVTEAAKYVIFEAAQGYTTNVPLEEALRPTSLVAHRLEGNPLPLPNGPPVRALVPHLYFWKSAKWLTGIRFSSEDAPGYWEVRGYHNHGDPWKEERYS